MERSDLVHWRLAATGLAAPPLDSPDAVVRRLLAVQSQDFGPALWAVHQRLGEVGEAAVRAAVDDGRIVRTHVLRPTWHFVHRDDLRWLLRLTAPRVHAQNAFMYRGEGLTTAVLDKATGALSDALTGGHALTRAETAQVLADTGIVVERFALGYTLMHAELEGIICSGPVRGKQQTYALVSERVPEDTRVFDRDAAVAELVLRYFVSHGPATVKDCAWWSGLTLTDIRAGIEAAGDQLQRVEVDDVTYWAAPIDELPPRLPSPTAFLLQGYDEFVVAFTQSKPLLNLDGQVGSAASVPVGVLVIDSQVVGHWKRKVTARDVVVDVVTYQPLDEARVAAVRAAAAEHGRFLGVPASLRHALV